MAAATVMCGVAAAEGDPVAGEKVYKKCKACHSLEAGENKIGPSLHGVVGRTAGELEGFKFSGAMKDSGKVWTAESIDAYLADPKGYIPGNKMAFPGLKKPEDRANVVAYIAVESD
jgi:cytochrome c